MDPIRFPRFYERVQKAMNDIASMQADFAEHAKRTLDGSDAEALKALRVELIRRKGEAGLAPYESKQERARVLQIFDSWIAKVNSRRKALAHNEHIEVVEKAMSDLRARVREMLPHLRYEGPDPIAWGRFCADMTEGSGAKK